MLRVRWPGLRKATLFLLPKSGPQSKRIPVGVTGKKGEFHRATGINI
jgi:hypothetical protein